MVISTITNVSLNLFHYVYSNLRISSENYAFKICIYIITHNYILITFVWLQNNFTFTVISAYWLRKLIYSFGYQVFTFYKVTMNTDFKNIPKNSNIFEVSIHFYCIKCEYLVPKWIDWFAKSVNIDDSDFSTNVNKSHSLLSYLNTVIV